jgi:hypothetical protein
MGKVRQGDDSGQKKVENTTRVLFQSQRAVLNSRAIGWALPINKS